MIPLCEFANMKILMLINGLYPEAIGGIEKIGADLAGFLAKKHDVVVYTDFHNNFPRYERRNNYYIKRFRSAADYKLNIPLGIRTINILRELRREMPKPQIILSMGLNYGFVSFIAKSIFDIPFLNFVLGSDWYIARENKFAGKPLRLGIKKCDALIAQTNIVKNDILKYFPGVYVDVIPNGITLPKKRACGDKIIYLGRLHEIKGIRYLIEAVGGVKNCPEVIIAGSGPEEEKLRKMAAGLNITFTGRIEEVEDVFLQGKIFILPSLSEGLPQAILEAMSYGLPVIASKVGGIPEVIEHGKTGYLVDPKRPEEIKKYLEILIHDDRLCNEMSNNSLREIKKYSWDNIMEKIEQAIVSIH